MIGAGEPPPRVAADGDGERGWWREMRDGRGWSSNHFGSLHMGMKKEGGGGGGGWMIGAGAPPPGWWGRRIRGNQDGEFW